MVVNILSKEKPLGMYHEGDEHPSCAGSTNLTRKRKKHSNPPNKNGAPISIAQIEYGAK
jgi:hypothetical protein